MIWRVHKANEGGGARQAMTHEHGHDHTHYDGDNLNSTETGAKTFRALRRAGNQASARAARLAWAGQDDELGWVAGGLQTHIITPAARGMEAATRPHHTACAPASTPRIGRPCSVVCGVQDANVAHACSVTAPAPGPRTRSRSRSREPDDAARTPRPPPSHLPTLSVLAACRTTLDIGHWTLKDQRWPSGATAAAGHRCTAFGWLPDHSRASDHAKHRPKQRNESRRLHAAGSLPSTRTSRTLLQSWCGRRPPIASSRHPPFSE